jgi:hypothetical protein
MSVANVQLLSVANLRITNYPFKGVTLPTLDWGTIDLSPVRREIFELRDRDERVVHRNVGLHTPEYDGEHSWRRCWSAGARWGLLGVAFGVLAAISVLGVAFGSVAGLRVPTTLALVLSTVTAVVAVIPAALGARFADRFKHGLHPPDKLP